MGVHNTTAVRKWKSANPANLGFDEYHATVAVAPTSTTNCGCDPAWAKEGKGCIAGGGAWVDHFIHNTSGPFFNRGMAVGQGYFLNAYDCQTFWTASRTAGPHCKDPTRIDRSCLTNYTKKVSERHLFDRLCASVSLT